MSLQMIPVHAMREKRQHQLDLRFSRSFKTKGRTLHTGFDIYNATNSGDVPLIVEN